MTFRELGVIKDIERLHALFDLFVEMLDQLSRMGVAASSTDTVAGHPIMWAGQR